MNRVGKKLLLASFVALVAASLWAVDSLAVPSFARQTGMACSACHTTFPQLTPFGRQFKVTGYSLTNLKQIEAPESRTTSPLQINQILPLSFMFQTSLTGTDASQPGTQNDNVEFPQQLSLFLAGEVAGKLGSFLQLTYTGQDDHVTMDNGCFRYATRGTLAGKDWIYGLTLTNNPGFEDLWNGTPVWGFPWASSGSAPTPAATTLVDGALGQRIAGLGFFSLWNDHLYAHAAVYRSAKIGEPQPPTGAGGDTIEGVAPYWRLAWQQDFGPNYLEVGTYGLYARLHPTSLSGPADKFTDIAFDAQYERSLGADILALRGTYIHENRDLDGSRAAGQSANATNRLRTTRINATYSRGTWAALSLGYFRTGGDRDTGLYAPGAVSGSANGSPDSEGWVAELAAYPWQNVRLSLQYTAYREFNGARDNYDGSGRDASDNNTLYWLAWFML